VVRKLADVGKLLRYGLVDGGPVIAQLDLEAGAGQ
jgi:hypothetical protein